LAMLGIRVLYVYSLSSSIDKLIKKYFYLL